MMPERADTQEQTEDELRQEQLNDPAVRARVREIFKEVGTKSGPGISAEELPDFLRDQRS